MTLIIAIIVLVIHLILLLLLRLIASSKVYFGNINLLWAALIPIFGPIAGLVIVFTSGKERDYDELYRIVNGTTNDDYDFRRVNGDFLSAEEVFILNNAADRRKTMLGLLRQDITPYMDILKLASTNDDVDTAHYATASLMQIQTDFQKDMSLLGAIASRKDATLEDHKRYAEVLASYLENQFLEEKLLRRHRLLLDQELKLLMEQYGCYDYDKEYIENLIMLEDYSDATEFCDRLLDEREPREEIYFLRIRLYIIQQDEKGMVKFARKLKNSDRTFSPDLQDELNYWLEDTNRLVKSDYRTIKNSTIPGSGENTTVDSSLAAEPVEITQESNPEIISTVDEQTGAVEIIGSPQSENVIVKNDIEEQSVENAAPPQNENVVVKNDVQEQSVENAAPPQDENVIVKNDVQEQSVENAAPPQNENVIVKNDVQEQSVENAAPPQDENVIVKNDVQEQSVENAAPPQDGSLNKILLIALGAAGVTLGAVLLFRHRRKRK